MDLTSPHSHPYRLPEALSRGIVSTRPGTSQDDTMPGHPSQSGSHYPPSYDDAVPPAPDYHGIVPAPQYGEQIQSNNEREEVYRQILKRWIDSEEETHSHRLLEAYWRALTEALSRRRGGEYSPLLPSAEEPAFSFLKCKWRRSSSSTSPRSNLTRVLITVTFHRLSQQVSISNLLWCFDGLEVETSKGLVYVTKRDMDWIIMFQKPVAGLPSSPIELLKLEQVRLSFVMKCGSWKDRVRKYWRLCGCSEYELEKVRRRCRGFSMKASNHGEKLLRLKGAWM